MPLELNRGPPKSVDVFQYFPEVQEMVRQKICPALVGAALLLACGSSKATEYRADEFLGLDLSQAVLSPKPLGPATEFAPVPVQARGDLAKNDHAVGAVPMRAESEAAKSKAAESKV